MTGVPTPFIVVYEHLVGDCEAAEKFVHVYLERKGYRISDNREFFSAPVSEVLQAILAIPKSLESGASDSEILTEDAPEEFSSFNLDDCKFEPWRDLWQQGRNSEFGLGDCLQDTQEAIRLYIDAAKLGCILSYAALGYMYFNGYL